MAGQCTSPVPLGELDPLALELLELTTDRFLVGGADGQRRFQIEKGPSVPVERPLATPDDA